MNYVQNVTDIDDPLLERAADIGIEWAALAEQQIQLFREDMAALNVLPPQHYVGAVESMPLIVDLIEDLRRRQAVYPVDDSEFEDLYFAQGSDPDFGSLAHLSEDEAIAIFAERGGDPDRGQEGPLGLPGLASRPGGGRAGSPA